MLKSVCIVDVEPSCNLYCLFSWTWFGNAPLEIPNVPPDDVPVNVAVKATGFDGAEIVVGSTLATNERLQDGPASYPDNPKILVTNNWFDCCKYDLAI